MPGKRVSTVDKIKWGVLGTASIAQNIVIPAMLEAKNCELWAIGGRSQEKADQFKDEFGFEKAYGSYEDLLADPDVEAVYICLPNDMHKEWVIKAAEAKKNILCEKPLAPSLEDAKAMFEAAEKNGVILTEAFAYLYSPYMTTLREEVVTGVVGELLFIDSEFITSDYNEDNIRMQKERLGGGMYDLGCYTISQILYLTGAVPTSIHACGELNKDGVDVLAAVVMNLGEKCHALCAVGMVLATEEDNRIDRLEIHGTQGFLRSRTQFNQEGQLNFLVHTDEGQKAVTVNAPNNYVAEITEVGQCILDKTEPRVTKELSLHVAEVLDVVLKDIEY